MDALAGEGGNDRHRVRPMRGRARSGMSVSSATRDRDIRHPEGMVSTLPSSTSRPLSLRSLDGVGHELLACGREFGEVVGKAPRRGRAPLVILRFDRELRAGRASNPSFVRDDLDAVAESPADPVESLPHLRRHA
jgi:hypothetical protein